MADAAQGLSSVSRAAERPRTRLYLTGAFGLASLVAALILIQTARNRTSGFPTSDLAVIESYTILAEHGRLWLGPYSRFSWHHPGPIYFYALVPFYAAAGNRTAGLQAGALAINVCCAMVAVLMAWRMRWRPFVTAVCAMLTWYAARFAPVLISIWNPHIIVFPMMALFVSSAAAMRGAPGALMFVAVLSPFVAQTHIGAAPTAMILWLVATIGATGRFSHIPGYSRRSIVTATVVFALCWTPVVIEQYRGPDHNLSSLWRYFSSSLPHQHWADALGAWSYALSGAFRHDYRIAIGAPIPSGARWATVGPVLIAMSFLSVVTAMNWMNRHRLWVCVCLLAIGVSAISLLSVQRIPGDIVDHVIFWISGIGVLVAGVVVAALWSSVADRGITLRQATIVGAVPALAILSIVTIGWTEFDRVPTAPSMLTPESVATRDLSSRVAEYLGSQNIKPLVRIDQSAWEISAGVTLQLQKRGLPFAIERDWLDMFTPAMAPTGVETIELTVAGPDSAARRVSDRGAKVIASSGGLTATVRAVQ